MFDSYDLPLSGYKNPTLQAWFKQWKEVITSDQTLQAMDSYTRGHYALLFLKGKARNVSFQDFLVQWHSHNLVLNDIRVGEKIQRLIKTELTRSDLSCQQSNVSRSTFCYFYPKKCVSLVTVWFISIMLTRGAVQNVLKALVEQEWCYWQDNFNEWVTHCLNPAVMWDGYHCHFVQCLAQARRWEDLKQHIDTMGETYLRELMQTLIQSVSTFISNTMGRTRRRVKRKGQKWGARFRRKPHLVDKITEGVAMGLPGPSPSFAKMGAFLAKKALKGIKDTVQRYRR